MRTAARWSWVWIAVALAALGSVAYELLRPVSSSDVTVDAAEPARPDELARVEGGFSWRASRGDNPVFELLAASGLAVEGGIEFLQDVRSLRIHTANGGAITLQAPSGRIEGQAGGEGALKVYLEGGVRAHDELGTELIADSLVYDVETRILTGAGPIQVSRIGAALSCGGIEYHTESKRLELFDPVDVVWGPGAAGRLVSSSAIYDPASGGLSFPEPVLVHHQALALDVLARSGRLERSKRPDRESVTLAAPLLVTGTGDGGVFSLGGTRLEFEASSDATQQLNVGGPVSVVVDERARTPRRRAEFSTGALEIKPQPGDAQAVLASGGFTGSLRQGPDGAPVRISGRGLELGVSASVVDRLSASGDVRVVDSTGGVAASDRLDWSLQRENLVILEGAPATVQQDLDVVESPRITFDKQQGMLFADGPVTTMIARKQGESATTLFGAETPIQVRSRRLSVPEGRSGWAEFTGPVQAWQGATRIRAGLLRFEREQRILEATADVWVTRNLPAADGSPARTARTGADRLRYVEATRTLTLEGAAKYQEEPGLRLEAESIAAVLSPNNEVESLVALGGVRLDSRGAKGTADRLEWTGGSRGSALLLGIEQFATLQSPDAPPLRGQRLRYDLATSQFAAEGGGGKTVIEEVPATGSAEKRP